MKRWLPILGLVLGGFVAAIALLAVVEGVLRLVGVGARPRRDPFAGFSRVVPLFEPATRDDGAAIFEISPARLRVAMGSERDEPQREFPAAKPAGGFRIFSVGDSSAAGVPYGTDYAFPLWLEEQLEASLPDARIEVVNAAVSGYATRRMLTVVEELAAHEPDLLIVYAGHNEFAERRFYAHLLDLDPHLFRLWEALVSTRIYGVLSGLRGLAPAEPPRIDLNDAAQGLQMFALQGARADGSSPYASPREIAWGEQLYRFNLEQMVRRMREAGARTLLVAQGQNFADWPPAASEHSRTLSPDELANWNAAFGAGRGRQEAGDCDAALADFATAARIDGGYAELVYRQAQCLRALGRDADARAAFRRASDLDRVPHGAPTRYNAIVREVAEAEGALFLDADALLERRSDHGLVGAELFTDALHPNLRAHLAIAAGIADTLRAAGIPEPADRWQPARWTPPSPEALYAAHPELRVQEHLIHGLNCMLAHRDACVLTQAEAALALDPGHAVARAMRDELRAKLASGS